MAKVTVTRAPRFSLVKWSELSEGTYFLTELHQIMMKGRTTSPNFTIDASKRDDINRLWDDGAMCYAFDSFEAMCKWVDAGRNPADLQSDLESEYMPLANVSPCNYFTHDESLFLHTATGESMQMAYAPHYCRFSPTIMVWPIRFDLGDKITIEGE